jgi:hypothetical protein
MVWGLSRPKDIKQKTYLNGKAVEKVVKWSWDESKSTMQVNLPAYDTGKKNELIILD